MHSSWQIYFYRTHNLDCTDPFVCHIQSRAIIFHHCSLARMVTAQGPLLVWHFTVSPPFVAPHSASISSWTLAKASQKYIKSFRNVYLLFAEEMWLVMLKSMMKPLLWPWLLPHSSQVFLNILFIWKLLQWILSLSFLRWIFKILSWSSSI